MGMQQLPGSLAGSNSEHMCGAVRYLTSASRPRDAESRLNIISQTWPHLNRGFTLQFHEFHHSCLPKGRSSVLTAGVDNMFTTPWRLLIPEETQLHLGLVVLGENHPVCGRHTYINAHSASLLLSGPQLHVHAVLLHQTSSRKHKEDQTEGKWHLTNTQRSKLWAVMLVL